MSSWLGYAVEVVQVAGVLAHEELVKEPMLVAVWLAYKDLFEEPNLVVVWLAQKETVGELVLFAVWLAREDPVEKPELDIGWLVMFVHRSGVSCRSSLPVCRVLLMTRMQLNQKKHNKMKNDYLTITH